MVELDSDEKDPVHDDVVLQAKEIAGVIADRLGFILNCTRLCTEAECLYGVQRLHVEMEYEVGNDAGFVDLAVFWDGELSFLMEIKSKREPQTASGWTRQVRRYEKATLVPAVLVVAHDLGEVQQKYLREADIHVLDLRTIRAPRH